MDIESFSLQQNYFSLFELGVSSQIDERALRSRYMELQRQYHPDNFASADDAQRRYAVQVAAFVNQAYQTLSNPLKRAEYCLQLQGVEVDAETDAKMDPMFLMEQMEWRETLEDIDEEDPKAFTAITKLREQIGKKTQTLAQQTAEHLEATQSESAREAIRKWQFLVKLDAEADAVEARLDEVSG